MFQTDIYIYILIHQFNLITYETNYSAIILEFKFFVDFSL